MYYWEQWRPVAVLVDCVGLTSVQPFCLVVFCLSCSLSPCFPQAVRLSHFLQGQWHRMQSKPCISLRPWRYCIICPFFVFFVQMMGNGKAALSVQCSHDNHRWTLWPSLPFIHIHPLALSLSLSLSLSLWIFPLMTWNAFSKTFHMLYIIFWAFYCNGLRPCNVASWCSLNQDSFSTSKGSSPFLVRGWYGVNLNSPRSKLQPALCQSRGSFFFFSLFLFLFLFFFFSLKRGVKLSLVKQNCVFASSTLGES